MSGISTVMFVSIFRSKVYEKRRPPLQLKLKSCSDISSQGNMHCSEKKKNDGTGVCFDRISLQCNRSASAAWQSIVRCCAAFFTIVSSPAVVSVFICFQNLVDILKKKTIQNIYWKKKQKLASLRYEKPQEIWTFELKRFAKPWRARAIRLVS